MLVSIYICARIIFWKVIRFLHRNFAFSVKIVEGKYVFSVEKKILSEACHVFLSLFRNLG